MNTISPKWIKETMNKYKLYFDKRFGQNFLIDENARKRIIESVDIGKDDEVIEIGPGLGSITSKLVKKASKVYAVEIDKRLASVLKDILAADNLEIICDDILKTDLNIYNEGTKVVGNLPYYITSAIIMRFLESEIKYGDMVFMMQKEVGERILSTTKDKQYGILTVICQLMADIEKVFVLSQNCFMPKPKVDSIVLKFKRKNIEIPKSTIKIVKAAFSNRRKTVFNSLLNHFDREKVLLMLETAGIEKTRRAQNIEVEEYIKMTKIYDQTPSDKSSR